MSLERIIFNKKKGSFTRSNGQDATPEPIGEPITILTPRYVRLEETDYSLNENVPEGANAFVSSRTFCPNFLGEKRDINSLVGYEFHAVQYYKV